MEGEKVFEMKGPRVDNVELAHEMGFSNNTHLVFANALIEQELYDDAAILLIGAVSQDEEIAQRWVEQKAKEEQEQKQEQQEMIKDILSSENADWISQVTREALPGAKRTKPRFLMSKEKDFSISLEKKDLLVTNLTKVLSLESIEDSDFMNLSNPRVYEEYDYVGEHFRTCFPGVYFIIFYKDRPSIVPRVSDFEKLEVGWYYAFSSYHKKLNRP